MTFDANNLSEEQLLGVLKGDLSLADVGAKPKATTIEELAEALPSGRDEKGKCTSVTAGDLTSMLSVVMNRQQGFIRWNLMSQEVEVNGSPLSAHQQECIYIPIQQRGYLARKSDAKDALAMAASWRIGWSSAAPVWTARMGWEAPQYSEHWCGPHRWPWVPKQQHHCWRERGPTAKA